MAIDPPFVERVWVAIAPDGAEHDLVLRIGVPQQQPGGDWTATVSLGVLDSKVYTIHGMDSWQAADLGMHHAAIMVRHYQSKGWQVLWERGGENASPSDLARGV